MEKFVYCLCWYKSYKPEKNPHGVWSNLDTDSAHKIYCQSLLKAAALGRKNALIILCVKEKDFTVWNID